MTLRSIMRMTEKTGSMRNPLRVLLVLLVLATTSLAPPAVHAQEKITAPMQDLPELDPGPNGETHDTTPTVELNTNVPLKADPPAWTSEFPNNSASSTDL